MRTCLTHRRQVHYYYYYYVYNHTHHIRTPAKPFTLCVDCFYLLAVNIEASYRGRGEIRVGMHAKGIHGYFTF